VTTSNDSRPPIHAPIPASVSQLTRDVAELWGRHLGERLAGIYLIGSLAHGGFSTRYSDIDVALIVEAPLAASDLDLVKGRIAERSPELAPRLSLFWADATFSTGRFPPLDRIDYLDHRRPLAERRSVLPMRPTLRAVRDYLGGEPLRSWSQRAMRLAALDVLGTEDHKPYLRALLYPARFLYSWDTGRVASNDEAVAYTEMRAVAGIDSGLIARALACRVAGADPSTLFAERHTLSDMSRALSAVALDSER
jgi:predicted nucleotidyltransferase